MVYGILRHASEINFIKEINPMNMRGLSRNKVVRQIKKLIKQSYTFKGYTEFSILLLKL